MKVVLGLGSNRCFGNMSCMDVLSCAVAELEKILSRMEKSHVYRTKAMYVEDQDDFYNMVVAGDYDGSPENLLDDIHEIEKKFGRDRLKEIRNGPRSLDVDIELFGKISVNEENLVIPHERLFERAFVLVPLVDVLNSNPSEYEGCFPCETFGFTEKLDSLGEQGVEMVL